MKLRNKKTGKIKHAYPVIRICDGETDICYSNIAEVNAEWEDYKPTEPLIKDEKIRKAVRAWAEATGTTSAKCWDGVIESEQSDSYIEFAGWPIGVCRDNYTVAELCGEGEE